MARDKKDTTDMYKSPFPVALRALMSEKPITTQEKLAEITGKTRQTVSQYVNGISAPGYDTLIKIADYFDVSTDYLLGRTADRLRKPSMIDELGISEPVAQWFRHLKTESTSHYNLSTGVNDILGDSNFQLIVRMLRDYVESAKAEVVYHQICHTLASLSSDGSDFRQRVTAEVYKVVENNIYGDTINKCLIGEDYVANIDVCNNPVVADLVRDGIVSGFSEVYASQASREFTAFLQDLKDNSVDRQTREFLEDNTKP